MEDFLDKNLQKLIARRKEERALMERSVLNDGPIGNYGLEQIELRPEYKENDERLKKAHKKKSLRRHNPDELVQLMYECKGNMSKAARACKVTRMTFWRWLKADGNAGIVREMDEIWNDEAEGVVNLHIENEDLEAAKFRLKTKGKDRGYTEKVEIDTRVVIEVKVEDE